MNLDLGRDAARGAVVRDDTPGAAAMRAERGKRAKRERGVSGTGLRASDEALSPCASYPGDLGLRSTVAAAGSPGLRFELELDDFPVQGSPTDVQDAGRLFLVPIDGFQDADD